MVWKSLYFLSGFFGRSWLVIKRCFDTFNLIKGNRIARNCLPSPQVNVGPFTIMKSIDALTESLADKLSAEERGFTISTKNIGNATFHF